jgi:hypothetical protein
MESTIIDKNHPDFLAVRHASLATAKDASRPTLQCVFIKDKIMYGCDGFRVHYAPVVMFDDGLFFVEKSLKSKVILTKDTDNLCYVNIEDIVPQNPEVITQISETSSTTLSLVLGAIGRYKYDDSKFIYSINYLYLKDAVECFDVGIRNMTIHTITISIEGTKICISGGDFNAAIQLIRKEIR